MAIFNDGNDKSYLKYVDQLLGILCVLLFLTSTPLNLTVLGFYGGKKRSHSAKLYTLLGSMYFTATILHPLVMAYNFFNGKDGKELPKPLLYISCGLAGIGMCCGGGVLTVISITRLYSLKYPLRRLGKKHHLFLTALFLGIGTLLVVCMFTEAKLPGSFDFNVDSKKQFLLPPLETRIAGIIKPVTIILRAVFFIVAIINIVVCGLTGYIIRPRRSAENIAGTDKSRQRRSVITIFYMNLIYTITIVYMMVLTILALTINYKTKRQDYFQIMSFVCFPFLALCLSVINPLVMICRGQEMRSYAWSRLSCQPRSVLLIFHKLGN